MALISCSDLAVIFGAETLFSDITFQIERGERWGPFRTYASLYLWRIADFTAVAKPAGKRSQG